MLNILEISLKFLQKFEKWILIINWWTINIINLYLCSIRFICNTYFFAHFHSVVFNEIQFESR